MVNQYANGTGVTALSCMHLSLSRCFSSLLLSLWGDRPQPPRPHLLCLFLPRKPHRIVQSTREPCSALVVPIKSFGKIDTCHYPEYFLVRQMSPAEEFNYCR